MVGLGGWRSRLTSRFWLSCFLEGRKGQFCAACKYGGSDGRDQRAAAGDDHSVASAHLVIDQPLRGILLGRLGRVVLCVYT